MPAQDSPAIIVARFLQANHYNDTLDIFIKEAGLPPDAGSVKKGDITIEKILDEKKIFDLSVSFEKIGRKDGHQEWGPLVPSIPFEISLPSSANLLHVSIDHLKDDDPGPHSRQLLQATTADRRLNFIDIGRNFTFFKSLNHIQDSPILSCLLLGEQGDFITISSGMSGQVVIYDHKADQVKEERRDHKKYVVKIASCRQSGWLWIATAGWDGKIYVYRSRNPKTGLGDPVASLTLPTNPETAAFVNHPDAKDEHILLVTRRDSTSLYYYRLPSNEGDPDGSDPATLKLLGSQNLAPHSNTWVAFSPSSVVICPTDPAILAVATSAVPHMKLIIVRMLLPPLDVLGGQAGHGEQNSTQTAHPSASLAIQDKEENAIQVHVSTLAPQTPYSTPQVVWRPDGSGVWVNGDDGVLRGLAATTGKTESLLKNGHEAGSKIRSIWCGNVEIDGKREEWLVSGGFDRRLVVWKPKQDHD